MDALSRIPNDVFVSLILTKVKPLDLIIFSQVNRRYWKLLEISNWCKTYEKITGKKFHWLSYMVCKYRKKPWSIWISVNPSLTKEMMLSHPELINYVILVNNPIITINTVKSLYVNKHINNCDWSDLSFNQNISFNDIWNNKNLIKWDFNALSEKVESFDFVLNHLDFDWDWIRLSRNPIVNRKIVRDNPNLPWQYQALSYNPNITIDDVLDDLNQDWNWFAISQKPSVTLEIINSHPNLPWILSGLSINPNITVEFVKSHPIINNRMNWDYFWISRNTNITWKIVCENPDFQWNYFGLSYNPSITIQDVLTKPNKKWNWYEVSKKPSVTLDFVKSHHKIPWDWQGLSENPSISWLEVCTNLDLNWNWETLSKKE